MYFVRMLVGRFGWQRVAEAATDGYLCRMQPLSSKIIAIIFVYPVSIAIFVPLECIDFP